MIPLLKTLTKRIGRIYSKEDADHLSREKGWLFKESSKKDSGYRRVVASPLPVQIFNRKTIGEIVRNGAIVIASGGGGIPVFIDSDKTIRPVEAVIDKDFASSLLASRINADEFYILTDVPYVFINYNEPDEQKMEFLNKVDAYKYLKEGNFGEGSMAPKIKAALSFIENGGEKSVITKADKLEDKSFGTKITIDYD